ncbi:HNH homing endonuclease [Bacillus phage vB_BcgM]|nr:HNH homing endonuclease [Bacillus phage vB_BcgM]
MITFEKGTRCKDPLYKRIKSVHRSMINRCYNPNSFGYTWYGAKGVTVCDEWLKLNGFIETIHTVEGFDIDKFSNGELELDKDSKDATNKVYSPETCVFLSKLENKQYKPSYQKEMVALSPTDEVYVFNNQKKFSTEHGVSDASIRDGLKGKNKLPLGWLFVYSDGREITKEELISIREDLKKK